MKELETTALRRVFAQNIVNYRKASKITQVQLAEKLGIKRCTIGAYEERRSFPTVERLLSISSSLGVSIEYLISKNINWSIN